MIAVSWNPQGGDNQLSAVVEDVVRRLPARGVASPTSTVLTLGCQLLKGVSTLAGALRRGGSSEGRDSAVEQSV